ncbi:MAG TPA: hypothetical protein VM345_03275 [Acidimicrobiales bacterium]|jgi:hypothetical protein|nr:hypothetical protein [Acidimicrobiales bacterium]
MRPRLRRAAVAAALLLAPLLTLVSPGAPARASDPPLDPPALARRATGYWFAAGDGGLFAYGDAEFRGSMGGRPLVAPVVGMAATPSGGGYWMVASDGGIFAFGDAGFHGSMGGRPLNRPIVGIAATPSGKGYWMVASDGGIFAFGDAAFHGSTGNITLNRPIVGMASTVTGRGYWLVASDGGIFAFGDAPFLGSTGNIKLNAPIVAMAATPSGNGYWMVATDGGIFTFGDATFLGSTGNIRLNRPIVGMSHTGFGGGYWLVASDGGVFSFGDAAFHGSAGNLQLASPVVAVAARPKPGPVGTAIFYYPWYDNPTDGDQWRHWDDPNGEAEPGAFAAGAGLIAADYFPARGLYSNRNRAVVDAQMAEIARAGVGTVVVSWWGRRSYEDRVLPLVVDSARRAGLAPAIHLEPYLDGTHVPEVALTDVEYLAGTFGISEVWIYASDGPAADRWRTVTDSFPGVRFWGHSGPGNAATTFPAYAARAGFDGIYTYDATRYSPETFGRICAAARARGLLCSPSVVPGYDDRTIRPQGGQVRSREGGARYDAYWRGAFRAGADVVSITSYNEWHEGTQIEAAVPRCVAGARCYENYEGAYGRAGAGAEAAYLDRTRAWTDVLVAAAR